MTEQLLTCGEIDEKPLLNVETQKVRIEIGTTLLETSCKRNCVNTCQVLSLL